MEKLTKDIDNLAISIKDDTTPKAERVSCEDRVNYRVKRLYEGEPLMYDNKTKFMDWQGAIPSKCLFADGIRCLVIRNKGEHYEEPDEEVLVKLAEEFDQMKKKPQSITKKNIEMLAKKYKILGGKWILHITRMKIDKIWQMIATCFMEGKLRHVCEISTPAYDASSLYGDTTKISFYSTEDFTNKRDIYSISDQLQKIGIKDLLVYKPDIYTRVGIYSNNEYRIRPTLYRVNIPPEMIDKHKQPSKYKHADNKV